MLKIILVRYGEAVNNLERKCSGWIDYNLTEKGKEQSTKTALFLKDCQIDEAYSSDLIRALDTAKIILKNHRDVRLNKCF